MQHACPFSMQRSCCIHVRWPCVSPSSVITCARTRTQRTLFRCAHETTHDAHHCMGATPLHHTAFFGTSRRSMTTMCACTAWLHHLTTHTAQCRSPSHLQVMTARLHDCLLDLLRLLHDGQTQAGRQSLSSRTFVLPTSPRRIWPRWTRLCGW